MELIPSLDNYVVTGSLTSLKTGANGDTLDRLSYPEGSPLAVLDAEIDKWIPSEGTNTSPAHEVVAQVGKFLDEPKSLRDFGRYLQDLKNKASRFFNDKEGAAVFQESDSKIADLADIENLTRDRNSLIELQSQVTRQCLNLRLAGQSFVDRCKIQLPNPAINAMRSRSQRQQVPNPLTIAESLSGRIKIVTPDSSVVAPSPLLLPQYNFDMPFLFSVFLEGLAYVESICLLQKMFEQRQKEEEAKKPSKPSRSSKEKKSPKIMPEGGWIDTEALRAARLAAVEKTRQSRKDQGPALLQKVSIEVRRRFGFEGQGEGVVVVYDPSGGQGQKSKDNILKVSSLDRVPPDALLVVVPNRMDPVMRSRSAIKRTLVASGVHCRVVFPGEDGDIEQPLEYFVSRISENPK